MSMLQGKQMKVVDTHDGKVYYENEIFNENLRSILTIFTIELSHGKFCLKSVGTELGSRIFLGNLRVQWLCFWPATVFMHLETLKGARKGSMVAEKTEIYCAHALHKRGGTHSKKQTVICAAQCFWPLHAFMHAESVWKHETGHKKVLWLPRYLKNTVTLVHSGER
jgi:hypothetical protein